MPDKCYVLCQFNSQGGDYSTVAVFTSMEKATAYIEWEVKKRFDAKSWHLLWWSESRPEHKPSWEWWHGHASGEYFVDELDLDPVAQ